MKEYIFDIGINTSNSFPDIECPKHPVAYISLYDISNNELIILSTYSIDNAEIFDNEQKLFERLMQIMSEQKVTLYGYNSEKWDIPYLISRLNMIGITFAEYNVFHIDLMKTVIDSFKLNSYAMNYVFEYIMQDQQHDEVRNLSMNNEYEAILASSMRMLEIQKFIKRNKHIS